MFPLKVCSLLTENVEKTMQFLIKYNNNIHFELFEICLKWFIGAITLLIVDVNIVAIIFSSLLLQTNKNFNYYIWYAKQTQRDTIWTAFAFGWNKVETGNECHAIWKLFTMRSAEFMIKDSSAQMSTCMDLNNWIANSIAL